MLKVKGTNRLVNALDVSVMGKLFVSILLIVIFEGAFRKWMTHELTVPLLLIRDFLAVYALYWSIKVGKMNARQPGAKALWLWSVFVVLWGFIQFGINKTSLPIIIIGIRYWLLYLWFAYAAAVSLSTNDFRYIASTLYLVLILMVPLIIVQFYSASDAFINQQVDGDYTNVFLVTSDIVRTTGTFSFTLGYTTFLAFITPFILAPLISEHNFYKQKWMHYLLILALAVAVMYSGSRAAILMFGLQFLSYIYFSLFYSKTRNVGSVFSLFSILLIVIFVPFFSTLAVDATVERFEDAAVSENFAERILFNFFGGRDWFEKISFFGEGLGKGTNLAAFINYGERDFLLAEMETPRILLEGGLIGFAFVSIKILVITFGLKRATRIAKLTGIILPLMIWFSLAIGLITWSIIGQLTVNALGYMLLSLGIALLRLDVSHGNGKMK